MSDEDLRWSVVAEAERIRHDGSLPPGFEDELRGIFEELSQDPSALEAELRRAAAPAAGPAPSLSRRALSKAGRASRRAAAAGRRRVGPRVRAIERRSIEMASRAGEAAVTETQVATDVARRLTAGTLVERALRRALAGVGQDPAAVAVRPLRLQADGRLADTGIDRFLEEQLGSPGGPVLHLESGDGLLVERLRAEGLDARGADPRHRQGRERRGALEALAETPRESLGGLVLSGVTDRVTPSSARALAQLAATRLAPGARLVLFSANPVPLRQSDPVASDLSPGRPLHPVTWCHLLARLGLEEIVVRESAEGSAYAVAARRAGEGP